MRLVMELTDRCNLRCRHCFDQRHAGSGDVPLTVVQRVLREAAACGVRHVELHPVANRPSSPISIRSSRCRSRRASRSVLSVMATRSGRSIGICWRIANRSME